MNEILINLKRIESHIEPKLYNALVAMITNDQIVSVEFLIEAVLEEHYCMELDWFYSTLPGHEVVIELTF